MTDPLEQAFPHNTFTDRHMQGLTKREYFAGLAMQGVIFWDATVNEPHETGKIEELAHQSVNMADALIAELNKKVKP